MNRIGRVYGEALYTLALEEQLTKQILDELSVLNQVFYQEPDFIRTLSAPGLSKQERCEILDISFRGRMHGYVLNFLKILTGKGYLKHFESCYRSFESRYNLDCRILPVTVITAVALTPEQEKKLTCKLSRLTGKQIKLESKVEPGCLGGVQLSFDGKCVDDTIAHRLDVLARMLKDTVL